MFCLGWKLPFVCWLHFSTFGGPHQNVCCKNMQTSDQKIWSRDVKLYVLFISDVRIKKWYFVKTWKDDSILSVCHICWKVMRMFLICGSRSYWFISHTLYSNRVYISSVQQEQSYLDEPGKNKDAWAPPPDLLMCLTRGGLGLSICVFNTSELNLLCCQGWEPSGLH